MIFGRIFCYNFANTKKQLMIDSICERKIFLAKLNKHKFMS